jgi:hypothetical protein
MGTAARALGFVVCFSLSLIPARPAVSDTLEELQRRFDNETDGVNKAKLLRRLGDAQFDREREAAKAGDYETAGFVMEKYRDNVRAAIDAVKKAHPDAEKHPAGYKQLEMHIEYGIREVGDLIAIVPEAYGPPLQIVKSDLLAMDNELLRALFPRRPAEKPLPPKTPPANKPPSGAKEKSP